jgi:hypothetical protein
MKLELKKATLNLLFILKIVLLKHRIAFLSGSERRLKYQLKRETDPKTIAGIKGLLNVINEIHTKRYRQTKLNHFKSIRQKDGKKRNRQKKL